jgi:hypothetical protein
MDSASTSKASSFPTLPTFHPHTESIDSASDPNCNMNQARFGSDHSATDDLSIRAELGLYQKLFPKVFSAAYMCGEIAEIYRQIVLQYRNGVDFTETLNPIFDLAMENQFLHEQLESAEKIICAEFNSTTITAMLMRERWKTRGLQQRLVRYYRFILSQQWIISQQAKEGHGL